MKRGRGTCHPSSQEVPPLLVKVRTHHLLPQAGLRTEGLNSIEVSHGRLISRWLGSNGASLQKLFRFTCITHVHVNAPNTAYTCLACVHMHASHAHTLHIPHAHSHTCLAGVCLICAQTLHIYLTHASHVCTHTVHTH